MINIEEIKPLIVERLKPLKPDKIILFDVNHTRICTSITKEKVE